MTPPTADSQNATATLMPLSRAELHNTQASRERVLQRIKDAGVCGLGGGRFDTAQKLRAAAGARALIINGMQSEPDNVSDSALLHQDPHAVIAGAALAAFCINRDDCAAHQLLPDIFLALPEQPRLGTELAAAIDTAINNEADWLATLSGAQPKFQRVHLATNHASGQEHQLAAALGLLGKKTASEPFTTKSEPLVASGVVCINLATAYAIARGVFAGEPLRRRMVSVNGAARWLDFGTPLQSLLGPDQKLDALWVNGRHGGMALTGDAENAGVHAGLYCINTAPNEPTAACINCSACVPACPVGLHPDEMWQQLDRGLEPAAQLDLQNCIECGACNAVCPSALPLAQVFRSARQEQGINAEKARLAEQAKIRSDARMVRLAAQDADRAARAQARTQQTKRSW